jgi:hypothetical protein
VAARIERRLGRGMLIMSVLLVVMAPKLTASGFRGQNLCHRAMAPGQSV